MIRTHIVPCKLNTGTCDKLNLTSGRIYSGIVARHWRLLRQKDLWLSEKSMRRLSDLRVSKSNYPMHAHSIDAAQEGFPKACKTTRALRKAGFTEANFPWRNKKFRTTVWKNTAIKFKDGIVRLSNGQGQARVEIALPDVLQVLEVRLVFDKKSRRYTWQNERNTSKTCPSCGNKHKPRGRNYKCPVCGFSGHRDMVGQVNILSAYKFGEPGKIPVQGSPTYRIPLNVRVLRKWADTPQALVL